MNDNFIIFWVFVLISLLIVSPYLSRKLKAIRGERQVSETLRKLGKHYKVINNVKLEIKGKISQIDHVVISRYGIFVIETKNYKGWILGNEHTQNWKQVIYRHKSRFYNPIKQNQGHIYALKHILKEYRNLEFISIIVFTNKAKLKTQTYTPVIKLRKLFQTIKEHNEFVMSENDVQKVVTKIQLSNLSLKQNRKGAKIVETQPQIKCPKCNDEMVERYGKYGRFYGCGNYPVCRFTSNNN